MEKHGETKLFERIIVGESCVTWYKMHEPFLSWTSRYMWIFILNCGKFVQADGLVRLWDLRSPSLLNVADLPESSGYSSYDESQMVVSVNASCMQWESGCDPEWCKIGWYLTYSGDVSSKHFLYYLSIKGLESLPESAFCRRPQIQANTYDTR